MKMCSFGRNIGLLPLFQSSWEINTNGKTIEADQLRIDQDVDENVQVWLKYRFVAISSIVLRIKPIWRRFEVDP